VKKLAVFLAALCAAASIGSQSLKENSYYYQSLELLAEAERAFEAGDYDAAAEYASRANEYALLSDQYVDKMIAITHADAAMERARDKIAWAEAQGAEEAFPRQYELAIAEMDAARKAYGDEDYQTAEIRADSAFESIDAIAASLAEASWPAVYIVRLIPESRECLWKIAAYPFIYNDASKWPLIYERNKQNFVDPSNPNLIEPGQKLVIPSLSGEVRAGVYDPARSYKAFTNTKK
jgi:nucleoid-associated protein YgaU